MNSYLLGQAAGELVLLVRARLAAGEPSESVVEWLVSRGWKEKERAEAWVKKVVQISRPISEHPNVTKALREKVGSIFGVCGTCGVETGEDGTRCNNCWEVERRLPQYLKTKNG